MVVFASGTGLQCERFMYIHPEGCWPRFTRCWSELLLDCAREKAVVYGRSTERSSQLAHDNERWRALARLPTLRPIIEDPIGPG